VTGPLIITMAVLVALPAPLALGLGIAAMVALEFFSRFGAGQAVQQMLTGIDVYVLLAVPLFILAGRLMNTGGITDRIFTFARCVVGHMTGGIAHTNVAASLVFAGMSGSSVADAAGLGQVEVRAMRQAGYSARFAGAVTAASSTIGTIIPPSIPMVIYAAIAEESVGRLFLAGVVPGILMAVSLFVLIHILARLRGYPRDPRYSLGQIGWAFVRALPALLTPFIIVGGIAGGIFTATEAAAVAVLYAFVLAFVFYRELTLRDIPRVLIETVITTASVAFILAAASAASWILVRMRTGHAIADLILAVTEEPWAILLILNIVLLLLGAVLELGAIMILLLPILIPILQIAGIDLVHFGIVMILNLMIGFITPPFGMALFVVSKISGVPVEQLAREVAVFILPLVVVLLLVTYLPGLVLFLPRTLMP
jgi:tripartite ATP-independent transporter DctM subunit